MWCELLVQFKFSWWSNSPGTIYEDSTFLNFSNRRHSTKWEVRVGKWVVQKSIYPRNYFWAHFCPSDVVTIPALGSSYLQNCSFVTSGPSECSHHAFLQENSVLTAPGLWNLPVILPTDHPNRNLVSMLIANLWFFSLWFLSLYSKFLLSLKNLE